MIPRTGSGWPGVAALATILAAGVGVTFYGLSVYLPALTGAGADFSLTTVSVATAFFLVVNGLGGAAVATLLTHLDARLVVLGGLLTTALGLVLVGRADSVWVLFTSYALMGAGFAATSVIPASHLVALWFTRRRTVAMSLVFVGLPVGGAVFTPPVAWLVESRGIEGASPLLAAGLLAIGAPMTLLLGPRTSEQPLPGSDPEDVGTPFGGAVRSRWFVLVTAALSLGMLSQLGLLAHLYHAVETRIDAPTAAWALSLTAASSLVGRLVASWALTRLRLSTATVWLLVTQGTAIAVLAVADRGVVVALGAILFGATMGNLQAVQPLLLLERYGPLDFARILGRGNLVVTLGMAAGPVLAGLLHGWTDDYLIPLAVTAVPALVGAACMARAGRLSPSTGIAGPTSTPPLRPCPDPTPDPAP